MQTLKALLDLLNLKQIDTNRFEGTHYTTPWQRVFGGQVLGQALNAAYQTVPEDRIAHSLHGYFILQGRLDIPIFYQVETLRDGKSFTTRRITAKLPCPMFCPQRCCSPTKSNWNSLSPNTPYYTPC